MSRYFKTEDLRLDVKVTLVTLASPKQPGDSSISHATEQYLQIYPTLTQQPLFYKGLGVPREPLRETISLCCFKPFCVKSSNRKLRVE